MSVVIPTVTARTILREISTTGHSPIKMLCDDSEVYIVKTTKGGVGPTDYEIVSEFLCSVLLELWNLNRPDFAGVVVPEQLITEGNLSNRHHPSFYRGRICFGSLIVKNAREVSILTDDDSLWSISLLNQPLDYLKIGLFDLWVCNDDRKPSNPNLLMVPDGKGFDLFAMDHAYTFGTLPYGDLRPQLQVSWNESILFSEQAIRIAGENHEAVASLSTYFYQYVERCKQSFPGILQGIEECLNLNIPEKAYLEQFLFDKTRIDSTFAGFLERLAS